MAMSTYQGAGGCSSYALGSYATGSKKTPSPIPLSTLQLDLNADLIVGADGSAVGTWANAGPAGLAGNFTQATGSKQPLLKKNIFSTHAAVLFDGVDDLLTSSFAATLGPCSFYCVFKNAVTGNKTIFVISDTGGTSAAFETLIAANFKPYSFAAGFSSGIFPGLSPASDINAHIVGVRYNDGSPSSATSYAASLDRIASMVGVSTAAETIPAGSALGARSNVTANWNGYIARLLYYTSNLSSDDDATVLSYLGTLYGI